MSYEDLEKQELGYVTDRVQVGRRDFATCQALTGSEALDFIWGLMEEGTESPAQAAFSEAPAWWTGKDPRFIDQDMREMHSQHDRGWESVGSEEVPSGR